ncbi:MAG: hypothetical protein OET79_10905, partial [Nitrospirota bacterium]|nr:hypothetical protein [Nitrospirota bacterium]
RGRRLAIGSTGRCATHYELMRKFAVRHDDHPSARSCQRHHNPGQVLLSVLDDARSGWPAVAGIPLAVSPKGSRRSTRAPCIPHMARRTGR